MLSRQLIRQNLVLANQARNFSLLRQRGGTISKRIGHDYRTFFGFVVIVPENYALLIHRFKKYHAQLEPGLNFKIPFIDTIEYVHDLREQAIEISS